MVRRRTAAATQTAMGGPPPRLVFAPRLLCSIQNLALRSTRRPLSNHPNEPLGTTEFDVLRRPAPLPPGVSGVAQVSAPKPSKTGRRYDGHLNPQALKERPTVSRAPQPCWLQRKSRCTKRRSGSKSQPAKTTSDSRCRNTPARGRRSERTRCCRPRGPGTCTSPVPNRTRSCPGRRECPLPLAAPRKARRRT